jgi:hypothetical protein
MWAKEFRRHDNVGSWTDSQVSDFVAMHKVDVWDRMTPIMESDILALGYLIGTMSDLHAAACRPSWKQVSLSSRGWS